MSKHWHISSEWLRTYVGHCLDGEEDKAGEAEHVASYETDSTAVTPQQLSAFIDHDDCDGDTRGTGKEVCRADFESLEKEHDRSEPHGLREEVCVLQRRLVDD